MDTDFADPLAVQLGYHIVKLDTPEVLDWYEPTLGRQVHYELWYYIADRNGKRASRNHPNEALAWEHFYREQWQLELELVRDKMREWANDSDRERAHGKADALLVTALESLSTMIEEEDDQALIAEIVEAYKSINKWYA